MRDGIGQRPLNTVLLTLGLGGLVVANRIGSGLRALGGLTAGQLALGVGQGAGIVRLRRTKLGLQLTQFYQGAADGLGDAVLALSSPLEFGALLIGEAIGIAPQYLVPRSNGLPADLLLQVDQVAEIGQHAAVIVPLRQLIQQGADRDGGCLLVGSRLIDGSALGRARRTPQGRGLGAGIVENGGGLVHVGLDQVLQVVHEHVGLLLLATLADAVANQFIGERPGVLAHGRHALGQATLPGAESQQLGVGVKVGRFLNHLGMPLGIRKKLFLPTQDEAESISQAFQFVTDARREVRLTDDDQAHGVRSPALRRQCFGDAVVFGRKRVFDAVADVEVQLTQRPVEIDSDRNPVRCTPPRRGAGFVARPIENLSGKGPTGSTGGQNLARQFDSTDAQIVARHADDAYRSLRRHFQHANGFEDGHGRRGVRMNHHRDDLCRFILEAVLIQQVNLVALISRRHQLNNEPPRAAAADANPVARIRADPRVGQPGGSGEGFARFEADFERAAGDQINGVRRGGTEGSGRRTPGFKGSTWSL